MNLHLLLLILHISCGFTALTVGIVPMISKKGGALHRGTGRVYTWAMYGVSASALGLFLLHPQKPFLQFLLCVAVLSFYLTFTGIRAINIKRTPEMSRRADKWVAWLTLGVSLFMIAFGSYMLVQGLRHNGSMFLGILYIVFGLGTGSAARKDLQAFYNKKPPQKMQWLLNHLIRMLSAYVATFTAFCVVNVHFLPPLIVWIMPGVIGGIMITITAKKYNKKFKKAEFPSVHNRSENINRPCR